GRLTLRNKELFSIVHLYFRAGKLAQVVGNRGDARFILNELREWKHAFIHFDRGIATDDEFLGSEYEQLLDEVLVHLHRQGLVTLPQLPKIIDSNIVAVDEGKQLIAPWEWQVLIEGTRRVSLVVARLVGPKQGVKVLRNILDDCASTFPAFASLQIASDGYLQVIDRSFLDRMSREALFDGFTALITSCQHFCSPIIGAREAHHLIVRALKEVAPILESMGVFQVDNHVFSGRRS
ncbi:MAG: hypothetical protein JO011_07455, partial [Ktedonobacteraceae bacterium]|nr:hypothetical protein [Ktedonobacteraceae bacterium]